jgi:pimeloyl-ACP methyl ester carboxylesterase
MSVTSPAGGSVDTLQQYRHAGLTFDVDDSGGDGDVVVLLHGFPETRRSWRRVTPHLVDAGYRVVAPDQRGYSPGARPPRRRDYALPLLTEDVMALVDSVGAGRFHVVGHDWGGAVAWSLAEHHADRVASVTSLATPHPMAMVRSFVSSTQLLQSYYMFLFQLPGLPERTMRSGMTSRRFRDALTKSGLPEDDADANMAMLRSGGARGALNWYRALPFGGRKPPGRISVPTLYVYGTEDMALSRKAADLTGRYVDGPYRYEVLEGASHWLPEAEADKVAPMVLEHLNTHPI